MSLLQFGEQKCFGELWSGLGSARLWRSCCCKDSCKLNSQHQWPVRKRMILLVGDHFAFPLWKHVFFFCSPPHPETLWEFDKRLSPPMSQLMNIQQLMCSWFHYFLSRCPRNISLPQALAASLRSRAKEVQGFFGRFSLEFSLQNPCFFQMH